MNFIQELRTRNVVDISFLHDKVGGQRWRKGKNEANLKREK